MKASRLIVLLSCLSLQALLLMPFAFGQAVQTFDRPTTTNLKPLLIWATSYWVHHADNSDQGIALRDMKGATLGPKLAKKDWCAAALEGTVRVNTTTYNYAGSVKTDFVDCSAFFKPVVGYSRFGVARGPFGDGGSGFILVPYRTVATDASFLKIGSVIFVPSAVGQSLPGGRKHDGYFFVGDAGGAIKGNHIDVFQGEELVNFSFVRSTAEPTFKAFVITDTRITEELKREHTPNR
jgi:3D (Asp-Asp-Asp) domain-containing protein